MLFEVLCVGVIVIVAFSVKRCFRNCNFIFTYFFADLSLEFLLNGIKNCKKDNIVTVEKQKFQVSKKMLTNFRGSKIGI